MIAGPPGSMKTFFALNIVMKTDVPTLYFSSDSDDHTMSSRILAYQTGKPTDETETWLKNNKQFAHDVLKTIDNVKWCFNPSPTFDDLELYLMAFAEIMGKYPPLIVIDILMDIDDGSGSVDQNYWTTMRELKELARETESAILLVHHTSESVKGEPVQPRSALMGKASQLPILIFNLAGDSFAGRLHVSIVKNRYGKSDLTGAEYFTLEADPALGRINQLNMIESG